MAIPKRSIASIKKEITQLNSEIYESKNIIEENNQKISENNRKLENLEQYEIFASIDESFIKTHANHVTKLVNILNSYYNDALAYYRYHYKGYKRAHSIENAWKKDQELNTALDNKVASVEKAVEDIPEAFFGFKVDHAKLINFLKDLADEIVKKEIEAEKEKK